jgi:hypothetical protein
VYDLLPEERQHDLENQQAIINANTPSGIKPSRPEINIKQDED